METWENKEHYMFRKLLVVAAAIAMPVSAVAATGGIAGASNSHAGSAATDTIVCKTITGTVTFSPKLTTKGYTSGATTTTVKATLGGCTTGGTFKTTVKSGAVTGTIKGTAGTKASPSGTCGALLSKGINDSGTLSTKWTATPAVPNSVLTIKSVAGGTKNNHGTFTIPGSTKGSAAGSFEGANKGSGDKTVAQTTMTVSALATACSKGISSLAIETEPGVSAVSLN
jgi:hypothetical protein